MGHNQQIPDLNDSIISPCHMKLFMRYCIILLTALCFTACKDGSKTSKHSEKDFFDLKAFVEQEVKSFEKKSCNIYKEGEINGESDQQSIDIKDFDWGKELKILADMDVRKSAWYDYFTIDTIIEPLEGSDSVSVIRYSTKSSKIPVKSLKISFLRDDFSTPFYVEAERKNQNTIFHTQQKIYYVSGTALRAEGYQKILWMKEKNFSITTTYNCKDESN